MTWNIDEAIAHYKKQGAPGDQSALISLLREMQQESGGSIPPYMLKTAASAYGIKESFLLALIRRIPSLRLGNTHCLELCSGPNCGKHTTLAACAEKLTAGSSITLKFVPCMRMCGKGPNVKWDGTLYHQASEELLRKLIKESR
nr:NAD(P)H-dependent oxidoreductase subunit E [Oscillospiraceae bacterium]